MSTTTKIAAEMERFHSAKENENITTSVSLASLISESERQNLIVEPSSHDSALVDSHQTKGIFHLLCNPSTIYGHRVSGNE